MRTLLLLTAGCLLAESTYGGEIVDKPLPVAKSKSAKGYQLEFKLVEVREKTDVNALAINVHPHPFLKKRGNSPHQFTQLDCRNCHVVKGRETSNQFFLRTFLHQPGMLKTWVKNTSGVKVLASPIFLIVPNRTATVNAKSPRKIQYLKQIKTGVFTLEEEKVTTGVTIKAAVQNAGKGKFRLKPLSVSVTAIKGREPIEGVKLDVGKPIVTTTSIQTTLAGKLGKASVISIDSPRGGRVLISVKVIDVKDSKVPIRSKGTSSSQSRKK